MSEPDPRDLDRLLPTQLRILGLLLDRDTSGNKWLASCYLAGHTALLHDDFPDAPSVAAHEFRELINNLWRIVPGFPKDESKRTDNVTALAKSVVWPPWKKGLCMPEDPSRLDWDRIRQLTLESVETLIKVVHEFLQRVNVEHPQKEQLRMTLELADPSDITVPAVLRDQRLKDWIELRGFFAGTAHDHTKGKAAVSARAERLDEMLLQVLVPAGAPAMAELDALIAEGEIETA